MFCNAVSKEGFEITESVQAKRNYTFLRSPGSKQFRFIVYLDTWELKL